MKKTEVYSWRIPLATKTAIENQARRARTTVSALLDRITTEWIESQRGQTDDNAEQIRLHARVRKTIGTIASGNPKRAARVRENVRERLRRRHGR
jgi:hypothetical protein